jgi:hypothetical protein
MQHLNGTGESPWASQRRLIREIMAVLIVRRSLCMPLLFGGKTIRQGIFSPTKKVIPRLLITISGTTLDNELEFNEIS